MSRLLLARLEDLAVKFRPCEVSRKLFLDEYLSSGTMFGWEEI